MLRVSSKEYSNFFIAEVGNGYFQLAFVTHKNERGQSLCTMVGKIYPSYWDASKALVETVEHYQSTGVVLDNRESMVG
jgi:hypothetical protein